MPHSAPRIRNDERQCIPSKFYSALDVAVIAYVKAKGIARYQACKLLQIKVRRIERWKERIQRTGSIEYGKPGPRQVVHAIMPVERKALVEYVGRDETVDYSFQMLALKGAEEGLFCMSARA